MLLTHCPKNRQVSPHQSTGPCVLHDGTTEGDVDALVDTVREAGAALTRDT